MISKKYSIIFIDIDGVLRDICTKIKEVMFKQYQLKPEAEDDYDFAKWYPSYGEEIYDLLFDKHVKEIFGDAKPFKYAIDNLISIYKKCTYSFNDNRGKTKVYLLSKQDDQRKQITNNWLEKNAVSIIMPRIYVDSESNDKNKREKWQIINKAIDYLQNLNLNTSILFIDDSEEELNNVRKNCKRSNIDIVCIDRSYNQNWKGDRVKSFNDITIDKNMNVTIKKMKE